MALLEQARVSLVVLEAEDRSRGPPDRPQQRRDPLRPLLQAGLAEGAQLRRGARGARPLLRRARHPARALRQGGGGDAARASSPSLDELRAARRARTGSPGLRRLGPEEIARARAARRAASPGCSCRRPASSTTGAVTEAYAAAVRAARRRDQDRRARLLRVRRDGPRAASSRRRPARSAAGAWSTAPGCSRDRVARLCGVEPGVRIVPFRGEYYELARATAAPGAQPDLPGAGPAASRSSACTSRAWSTAGSRPARTPCWRSSARATRGPASRCATPVDG